MRARDGAGSSDVDVRDQVVHPCPCGGGVSRGEHGRIGRGSTIVIHSFGICYIDRTFELLPLHFGCSLGASFWP